MRQPSLTTRVRYSPRPFTDYCPSPEPQSSMLWHAVTGDKADEDLQAARWNLIWLCSPELDQALALPRRAGPHWKAVVANVHLSVLAPIWPELRHAVLCQPAVFRAWLHREREREHLFLINIDPVIEVIDRRLEDAIQRLGGAASTRVPPTRVRGNVTFVDFRAARQGG